MKTDVLKRVLKYFLSLLVAGVLLYFSFKGVNWNDFVEGLKGCNWWFVALSGIAGVMAFYLRGLRWRDLLQPLDPSISRRTAFNAVNIGYIANFALPRIGEFVRCGVITKKSKSKGNGAASYDRVLGTVVLERVWDLFTMILLIIGLLLFTWRKFGQFFTEEIFYKMNLSIWWLLLLLIFVSAIGIYSLWRWRNSNKFFRKIWSILSGLFQGFGTCVKMEGKWRFILHTVLIWAMYWLMAASIMWSVPDLVDFTMADALFLSLVGGLGWVIPVPGGFGAFHYIVSLALTIVYGIPMEVGVVFATLSHETQALTMLVFGGLSYLDEAFITKK